MPAESSWRVYQQAMTNALAGVEGVDLDALCEFTGSLHFIGNGASASMASHMAADWLKTAHVPAYCYNDAALMSACGNDLGYIGVFATPLSVTLKPTDTLVVISSSGESPNIIAAIQMARARRSSVVTLTGKQAWNRARGLGDINVYVPSDSYGIVESCHAILLHAWLDHYVSVFCKPDGARQNSDRGCDSSEPRRGMDGRQLVKYVL